MKYKKELKSISSEKDIVATEYALTIKINQEEIATIVCTPEYLEDLVIGFLASEGIIKTINDIKKLIIQERMGIAHLEIEKKNNLYNKFKSKRYITSCCGMSRQGFIFVNDALTVKDVSKTKIKITPKQCFEFVNKLQYKSDLFVKTGGVHNAAICDDKEIILARQDIGRHNALDKIYGYCLKNKLETENKIIVFSGRISSEILLKVSKMGVSIILSKSAPTELALEMAKQLGITVIGFIRNDGFNIYTREDRLEL